MYGLWAQRVHWPDWFSMIEEVGFREGDPDACALNMWYRWGEWPAWGVCLLCVQLDGVGGGAAGGCPGWGSLT